MLKIRRYRDRLIFNIGIPIPGKTVFHIETSSVDDWYMFILQAKKLNATSVENVARVAHSLDAQFAFYSTDYVFDGTQTRDPKDPGRSDNAFIGPWTVIHPITY